MFSQACVCSREDTVSVVAGPFQGGKGCLVPGRYDLWSFLWSFPGDRVFGGRVFRGQGTGARVSKGYGIKRGRVSRGVGYPGKGTHYIVNAFEFLIYCH